MLNILQNLLLGLTLAAPIGPVNVAVIKKGLKHGFVPAFLVSLGAACADTTYLLIVYLGLSDFFTIPLLRTAIWVFGALFLLYIGYKSVREYFDGVHFILNPKDKQNSFVYGYMLTLLNPMTLVWWLGVFGPISSAPPQTGLQVFTLLTSLTIIAGVILWFFSLSVLLHWGKRFVNEKTMGHITLAAGLVLFCFGLIFLYNGFTSI